MTIPDGTNQGRDSTHFNQMIETAMDSLSRSLRVAVPAIVEAFDPETQTVTCTPTFRQHFIDEDGIEQVQNLPKIANIPICIPEAKGFSVTLPISKGDEVILLICDRALDGWFEQGGIQNQSTLRLHNLSDAVAIIGINSKPNTIQNYSTDKIQVRNIDATTALEIDGNGQLKAFTQSETITIDSNGNATVQADTKITLDAPATQITGTLQVDGAQTNDSTIVAQDDVTGAGVSLETHVHTGVTTGVGVSGPPQ